MAGLEWTLRTSAQRDRVLAELRGSIDERTAPQLKRLFESLRAPSVILDFAAVAYVNSSGLGTLVGESDRVRSRGGRMTLVRVAAKVKVVFEMLGLNAFFDIADDREALRLTRDMEPLRGGPIDDPRVHVTDPGLTASFGDKVLVGSAFAFFHEAALQAPGLRWVASLLGAETRRPRVVSLLGRRPVELPGASGSSARRWTVSRPSR